MEKPLEKVVEIIEVFLGALWDLKELKTSPTAY